MMFEFYFTTVNQGNGTSNVALYALLWSMFSFLLGFLLQHLLQRWTKRREARKAADTIENEVILVGSQITKQQQDVQRYARELRSGPDSPENLAIIQELAMDGIIRFDRSTVQLGQLLRSRDSMLALKRTTALFTFCEVVKHGHERLKLLINGLDEQSSVLHQDFQAAMRVLSLELHNTLNAFEVEQRFAEDPFVVTLVAIYRGRQKITEESLVEYVNRVLDPLLAHLVAHKHEPHANHLLGPTLRALELSTDMKQVRERYALKLEQVANNLARQFSELEPRILRARKRPRPE